MLLRSALRDLAKLKRLTPAALLIALPAAIALIWRLKSPAGEFPADIAYNTLCSSLVYGFALVILAVVFGTATITEELEQKTIVYLITHALPRSRILLVKLFSSWLATTIGAIVSCGLLALAVYAGSGHPAAPHLSRDLAILPVGALAYNTLFVLLATLISRPLLVGLVFAFGWESWVPSMPGNFSMLSIMSFIRALAPHPQPASDTVDLTTFLTASNPDVISQKLAWSVLAIVTAFCLTSAVMRFSTAEYVPREEA